jgi:BirA family transcriptional regulator, biotin operon repressor / biotin---[acetyl-CoA-carboxylase] ligase
VSPRQIVHRLETVDSTNSWMARRYRDLESGTAVFTLNQTAGRGRRGRTWEAPPGDSLAFSLVLDAFPPGFYSTWLPLLAGVSVVRCVENLGLDGVGLKWPNDVLLASSKLAGILVEVLPDARFIVGVGINLRTTGSLFADLRATSLAAEGILLDDLVAGIISPFSEVLEVLVKEGVDASPTHAHRHWQRAVEKTLTTIGRRVEWENGHGETESGIAQSLADTGALIVSPDSGGDDVVVHSGDVFHIQRS